MKKILATILITVIVFSLVGCSAIQTKLDTPINVRVEDGILKWSSVDEATEYLVVIDLEEYSTTSTSYDLTTARITAGQEYTMKVKATKSDSLFKSPSDFSTPIKWVAPADDSVDDGIDNEDIVGEKETLSSALVESIVNSTDTNSTYYGVGRTINVITDEYANFTAESVGHVKVFDSEKLSSLNWFRSHIGDMRAETFTGSSMESLYVSANLDFKKSFSSNLNYCNVFSAGLDSSFKFSAGVAYENTANEIYHTSSQYYGATLVAIDEYYDISQFENVLSESFIEDIIALENGTKSAAQIIAAYGTHAILAGYYGGKITCNSYVRNTSTKWDANAAISYESKLSAAIGKILSGGTSTSLSLSAELGIANETMSEEFTATSVGGANFKALTLQDFLSNYDKWVASMNDMSMEKSVIVGLPSRSLVSIWDILPQQYSKAKSILADYFNAEAESANSAFLSKYERHYNEPIPDVDYGDTVNFAGGHGTKASPYLVSTRTHFVNMVEGCDETKYYKLQNDIDLEDWSEYGMMNWKKESRNAPVGFTGYLDGNGKTVTYSIAIPKTSVQSWAFGLFPTTYKATIENLKAKANIYTYDPQNRGEKWDISNDDRAQDAMVGGIVGYARESTIVNCSTSGNIRYNSDGGSSDTCVGGVVGYALSCSLISKCSSSATLYARGKWISIGGVIACCNKTTYSNLYASCSMSSNEDWAGGSTSKGETIAQDNKEILTDD